jgi:hypothetical protein
MLSDPDSRVQMASCLSLYRIFTEDCIDALVDVMMNGGDELRRFVAELLAFKTDKGHTLLKELAEQGNIKCKKAVVSGLRLVSESWATDLLQKISTSDSQWLVRDAAAHALETPWNLTHYIPSRRTKPSETSWIIQLASQDGYSIPADVYPYELLYHTLNTGVLEERVVSLGYLAEKPDEKTNQKLIELMEFENPLREEAFFEYEKIHKKLVN